MATRRQFLKQSLVAFSIGSFGADAMASNPFQCTPAPKFPVPLTTGIWNSAPFPVGKHNYHVWLNVDRRLPLEKLDCDLGPADPNHGCDSPPLLDVEWKIWDGKQMIESWPARPPRAAAWAIDETSCFLGTFNGKRNGTFTLEWNVKRDGGSLKDLHPRVYIVKNPGYWCWL